MEAASAEYKHAVQVHQAIKLKEATCDIKSRALLEEANTAPANVPKYNEIFALTDIYGEDKLLLAVQIYKLGFARGQKFKHKRAASSAPTPETAREI